MKHSLLSSSITSLALFLYAMSGLSAQAQTTIMPLGDSITLGIDFFTDSAGGYRDPLYRDLIATSVSFSFVGVSNESSTSELTASGNAYHNGFSGYRIDQIQTNLNGNSGDSGNLGGYWLTGGNGTGRGAVTPNIVLLLIGGNDINQHYDSQTTNPTEAQFRADMDQRLYNLVTAFHSLSPNSIIMVAGITPINTSANNLAETQAYNSYIQTTLVPSLSYTRFVDQYSAFLNADGSVNTGMMGTDDLHPDVFGYTTMAVKWAGAIWSYLGTTPTTYNLTVVNGLGGGSYPAGVSMSISASPAGTGSQFSYWSPAILPLSNPYWPLATYVMPAAATTLNANDVSSGSPILPNGTYRITSLFAGDGLAVGAAGTSSGSLVQQQTYTGSATQQWTLANLGNNVVELTLAGTNTALEVVGASKTVGANINVATYTGATNQQWTITPQAGATELVNVNSGLAIEIGYSTQPGAQLDQDTVGNGPIQWWAFYPLGPAPVITSSLTASATAGTAFSYQITASNSPTSYNATGLPAGLKVNTATGLISGTPTVSGTFPIMISATSATGTTTVTLTLTLAASTDTPTMPQWALLLLAALLFGVAARQRQPASWLPFFSRIRVFSTALSEWRRLSQTRAGKESLFHILKKRIIVPDQILVDRGFIFYVF